MGDWISGLCNSKKEARKQVSDRKKEGCRVHYPWVSKYNKEGFRAQDRGKKVGFPGARKLVYESKKEAQKRVSEPKPKPKSEPKPS